MSIVAIDTGGTFTDVVYLHDGRLHVFKLASTPDDPARAVIEAVRSIASTFDELIHGSTVATNALLERKGAVVALITNRGFEDVIEIGRQNRPQLYALSSMRLPPLVARDMRVGIAGRIDYTGAEIEPLGDSDVVAMMETIGKADALAVCLLHSYANATHERRVGELARKHFPSVTLSSEILPEYREYERTATTVVNAYVAPLMSAYLQRLADETGVSRVRVMGSGGGAMPIASATREPVHTVLSGPAGGVAGAIAAARAAGFDNIITFDMGGTSTDVSLCPGKPLHTREFTISGVPVAIPVMDIHTVGAGGGSIAWLDAAGALRVGPASARAMPGPICYGNGGTEITVTDANVWLDRLPADAFLGGNAPLDRDAIAPHIERLAHQLGCETDEAALGVIAIANTTMETALRVISVERGYDPIDFTLVAFGGAAGLHAAELAERLGIERVLIPPHPGALSAFGMLATPVRKAAARTVMLRQSADGDLPRVLNDLETEVVREMNEDGVAADELHVGHFVDARYRGQSYELRVPALNWRRELDVAHERRYGFCDPDAIAEVVTARVEGWSNARDLPAFEEPATHINETRDVVARASLDADGRAGPLVVAEYSSTTWVPRGWHIRRLVSGALLMYVG